MLCSFEFCFCSIIESWRVWNFQLKSHMFYNKVCREADFVGAAVDMVLSCPFAWPRFSYPHLFVVSPGRVICEKKHSCYILCVCEIPWVLWSLFESGLYRKIYIKLLNTHHNVSVFDDILFCFYKSEVPRNRWHFSWGFQKRVALCPFFKIPITYARFGHL